MFASMKNRGTVIAKGLKIVGRVTAEGLVEVNGQIDGEIHCTSLIISRGAHVSGTIAADRVVVDGNVEGPIQGGEVILKSQSHVVGDIHSRSLAIDERRTLRWTVGADPERQRQRAGERRSENDPRRGPKGSTNDRSRVDETSSVTPRGARQGVGFPRCPRRRKATKNVR